MFVGVLVSGRAPVGRTPLAPGACSVPGVPGVCCTGWLEPGRAGDPSVRVPSLGTGTDP